VPLPIFFLFFANNLRFFGAAGVPFL